MADRPDTLLEFETLISELSARFIHLPPGEVDRGIEEALQRVCGLLDLDLAVLWQWSHAAADVIAPTHVASAVGPPPTLEPMRQEDYPWYRRQMLAGRVVAFASLDELPPEAAVDRASGRAAGIRSNLCLPLVVGGEPPLGALALSTLRDARTWDGAVVKRLQLVAQVFTNALARQRHELERKRAEEALRRSEARLASGAELAGLAYYEVDYGAGTTFVDDRFRELSAACPRIRRRGPSRRRSGPSTCTPTIARRCCTSASNCTRAGWTTCRSSTATSTRARASAGFTTSRASADATRAARRPSRSASCATSPSARSSRTSGAPWAGSCSAPTRRSAPCSPGSCMTT